MKFLRFFKNFYNVYVGVVFLLVVFAAPFIGYQFRRNYASDNIIIFFVIIALVIFGIWLLFKFKQKNSKLWNYLHSDAAFKKIVLFGVLIVFILQLVIDAGGWFIVGWDTRNVIYPDMQMDSDYMSMYPNQLFLAGLFRRIFLFLNSNFSIGFYGYYFCLVLLSSLAVCISVLLIPLISRKLTDNFCAILTFLFAAIMLGLSPWIMVPYSDNFAMLCTTLTLFCYVCINNKYLKYLLVFFVSIIGFFIKPTAIFVLFAILFVEFCKVFINIKAKLAKFDKSVIVKFIGKCFASAVGLVASIFLCNLICNYGVKIDEDSSFTATHFLMMGVNYETRGGWNIDDVNMSRSYYNVEEREAANIKEWKHRLLTYGPSEISWILFNKTLTNYADGSFSWKAETPWCIQNRGNNPIIWLIYGIDPADKHNDNNNYSAYVRQVLWLITLIGCALMILNRKINYQEIVMCCSLLAISAFLTICEPDPRYLFLYVPYMIIFAVWGWKLFISKLPKIGFKLQECRDFVSNFSLT